MKVSLVQMESGADKGRNVAEMLRLLDEAAATDGPDLVVFPELSACLTSDPDVMRSNAEDIGGTFVQVMSDAARQRSINILTGSFVERRDGAYFNTSVLLDKNGNVAAKYSKIHLYDVVVPNGVSYHESALIRGGSDIVTADIDGIKVGMSICYDIRFSTLYRRLAQKGAEVSVIPAAFTFQTGSDHWEILVRARAIETQCYVVAAGQTGSFDGGKYPNWGHSMIVDPWGVVIAQMSNRVGSASANIDIDYMRNVRARMPVREHDILG